MRNFNQRFRLRDSDRHIRLLYTFFLLLMLAGFTFSFFWAHSMTGLSPQGIASHYRGSDITFGEPMSFRELAEITHFHLFTMPVVFMILVHVLYLTSVGNWLKVLTTWASFGGVMLDLVSPWLISYVSPLFVLTMLMGDSLMTVGFLIMMTIPLYEMWILKQPLMAGKQTAEEGANTRRRSPSITARGFSPRAQDHDVVLGSGFFIGAWRREDGTANL
jgi:hypothetical protein